MSSQPTSNCVDHKAGLTRLVPALDWLRHYERKHLPGDALAGVIVATLLIPQGMAYALLAGLPPQFGLYASLFVSVAKTLAAKRRQIVDSNQELIALGAANFAAGVTGAYPVTGGFSRSVVNFSAGANTGLASLITASLIAVSVLFLMPLFHHLPQAVLGAVIILAVAGLIDFATPRRLWRYNKADAVALILTFVAVLAVGIEKGILIGVASTIILHLWRTSRPHMAVIGRVVNTEHFRNVLRHETQTLPHILMLRIDESLYFANAKHIEDVVLCAAAQRPQLRHLVLICSAINFIDASALETLTSLLTRLHDAGIQLYLTEVQGPVMDRLARTAFLEQLGHERVFLTTQGAYETLRSASPAPTPNSLQPEKGVATSTE